jgi:hypothetical protein
MTTIDNLFGLQSAYGASHRNRYVALGYPTNPFRVPLDAQGGESGPLYCGHIERELNDIQNWVQDVVDHASVQPLSLIGNIGAGKTRVLRHLQRGLLAQSLDLRLACDMVVVSDAGYSRASLGALIVGVLERMSIAWAKDVPDGVLPLIWAIVTSNGGGQVDARGNACRALIAARKSQGAQRVEQVRIISRWLQRVPLTASEMRTTGLVRRIDWEGELILVLAEILGLARAVGALSSLFLFVDQLEDLFRGALSELRRSRILTDLRGLVDEIDAGAPIGLIVSWSPEVSAQAGLGPSHEVGEQLKRSYAALFNRLERRQVRMPLLSQPDAAPFAAQWINYQSGAEGWNPDRQPPVVQLVDAAWDALKTGRKLIQGAGTGVTPRELLTALADEVDRRAGPS